MKKTLKSLAVILAVAAMPAYMIGCTGDTNSNTGGVTSNTVQDLARQGTLQGKIMDGVTGEAIGGSDTKIYLIQGTDNRTPNKFVASGDLQGEYAFTNIPLDTTQTQAMANGVNHGSSNFKIVVIKNGYQRFEGEISPSQFATTGTVLGNGDVAGAAQGTITFDKVYNKIGNIYIYPTGATAKDYTVKVRYNGAAVAGATVELQQNATDNAQTSEANANVIAMSSGYLRTLTATTDASGNALFKGSDLVLGGAYTPVVLPIATSATALTSTASYAGQQADILEEKFGTLFSVGAVITSTVSNNNTSTGAVVLGTEQTISMVGANNNDSSLFVTSITNSTLGILADSGALTITFNRPVQVNNNNRPVYTTSIDNITGIAPTAASTSITVTNTVYGFGASISSTANSMVALLQTFGATSATKPVVATLDATQTKLTLTPQFATAKGANDYDLAVTYYDAPFATNIPAANATTVSGVTTTVNYAIGAATAQPSVSPVGKPELQYNIFSVAGAGRQVLRNGASVTSTVRMTAPAAGL